MAEFAGLRCGFGLSLSLNRIFFPRLHIWNLTAHLGRDELEKSQVELVKIKKWQFNCIMICFSSTNEIVTCLITFHDCYMTVWSIKNADQ